ncbi:UNVERIFIED_CONTAM: hypothetical protein Sindi_2663200 [Sesamum indicum]
MRVPSGFDGRGCLSPLVACDAEISSLWWAKCRGNPDFGRQGRPATACTPDRSLPVAPTQGGCGRRRRLLRRDPEISSTWLAKCRQSRHARAPARELGYAFGWRLLVSPSPAKVEASHRQVGPVPRFFAPRFPTRASSRIFVAYRGHALGRCLLPFALPRRSNASWDGGRWLVCSGIAYVMGRVSGDWRVWHVGSLLGQRQHPPQAASVVGPKRAPALGPRSVSCAAYPSRRHSIVPNVPFSPCAAPPPGPRRGVDLKAPAVSHVPRTAARARVVGPLRRRPISRMRNTRWVRGLGLCLPRKQGVRRFVANDARHRFGLVPCGRRVGEECYLVDPASSHMLVSKIKPCMCKYELIQTVKLRMAQLKSVIVCLMVPATRITGSNSRANTCNKPRLLEGMHLLDKRSTRAPPVAAMIHDNSTDRTALVPATHHSNFCPINFRWVRFRRGSLRNGYHIQGRQQARKLPNPDTGSWTLGWAGRSASGVHRSSRPFCRRCAPGLNWPGRASGAVYFEEIRVLKASLRSDFGPITLAFGIGVMINRDSRGAFTNNCEKHLPKDVFINQERKLGARRRSDTVLVSTINDADQGSADVAFRTPPAPYEKSKSLGSGGSMVARLKLKGIDGRAPPGVEPAGLI